jgi:hypothetical protein
MIGQRAFEDFANALSKILPQPDPVRPTHIRRFESHGPNLSNSRHYTHAPDHASRLPISRMTGRGDRRIDIHVPIRVYAGNVAIHCRCWRGVARRTAHDMVENGEPSRFARRGADRVGRFSKVRIRNLRWAITNTRTGSNSSSCRPPHFRPFISSTMFTHRQLNTAYTL